MIGKFKLSEEDFVRAVTLLHEKTKRFKEVEGKFKKLKAECNQIIDQYFKENSIEKSTTVSCDDAPTNGIKVSKVERVSVKFDADKIERALPKEVALKVVNKKYEINDIFGLVSYLKGCGVDPKVFKSFLSITKSVNVSELERLSALGEIDEKDLDGCFLVTKSDPYYKLRAGKGDGDD